MRTNVTKAKVKAGELVIGGSVNYYAPPLVELIGALGFDFVFIDCEHGSMNVSEVENLVRAAEAFDITPIARVPDNSPHTILRFLDRGIMGLIVPHVETRADAEAAVRAAKYYPEGERGSATSGRTSDYGTRGLTAREYYEYANRETMVIALVESTRGVENAAQIAAVPGIDVVHVGPSDLAQSMGLPAPREVERAIERVMAAARSAGKACGVGAASITRIDQSLDYAAKGARFFTIGTNDLFRYGAGEFLRRVRESVGRGA